MIQKANDVVLNVLPFVVGVEHQYYYEGPCRFGSGEALQPGFDRLANEQNTREFLDKLKEYAPAGVNIMEPVRFRRTDDWDNSEALWEAMAPAVHEADFVVAMCGIGGDDIVAEFAERFQNPIAIAPKALFTTSIVTTTLHSKNKDYEVYGVYQWDNMPALLSTMRARKVIQTTRILLATRFGSNTSFSSVDSFGSHEAITTRLGVRFRYVNIHEMLDQMSPAVEGGNPTTPGRKTWDLTDEDMAEVNRLADELMAGAEYISLDRQYLVNSLIAYVTVKKNMDRLDCCGFTVPCPDVCSTRRLNEQKFTFCLTHSLNMEQGIPSSCEFDVDSVLSQQALIAVSGKRPYMGNTSPLPNDLTWGTFTPPLGCTRETLDELAKTPGNLYMMQHSVAHRCLHDTDKHDRYELRHFAYDQGFGAVIRHDFNDDVGQTLTFCRFSPDGSKLFISRGEVVAGDGYSSDNCSNVVYFRVRDIEDTWAKQCFAGNHCCMVFGDYTKELTDLAKALKIEPLVAI